jgi:hypothetical protein
MQEYTEYFFENFKGGGRGGGWRKKKKTKNDEEDELRDSIRSIGIFFTLFAFIYYINALFPKQSTSVLKRYDEAFDYINNITYLAIFIIIILTLYTVVIYIYNNDFETPDAEKPGG